MKFFYSVLVILAATQASAVGRKVPTKFKDAALKIPATVESYFQPNQIESQQFVEAKKAEWKACHKTRHSETSIGRSDSLKRFLQTNSMMVNLVEMETKDLLSAEASVRPWSGDYWPYSHGILGARFQDSFFVDLTNWKSRYDYIQKNPASRRIQQLHQGGVKTLSAAEKYDLIIGDDQYSFSQSMWTQGKTYYDENGKVEDWMGICHGWASAAIMEPRPVNTITVKSYDQKWQVPLVPSEIKGLVSYSWATNSYPTSTLGARCNIKNPKKDKDGRIIDPDCFDLNPGMWHIAMVHLLGVYHRSFVMDATYDYEVWNQPIMNYSYNYYNVQTGERELSFNEAVLAREMYADDPFSKHRSKDTKMIVGIVMKVGYVVENMATSQATDSEDGDVTRWVEYTYDLELNNDFEIIGGEWRSNAHPDFIWIPKAGAQPLSQMDRELSPLDWNPEDSIPREWADAAQFGSINGVILNRLTHSFLERSTQK
ncbi:MAG: hypothetical protein A2622_00385 [Bdellovibrionales bacterium RIFCSPHIGHO2_01_FULL_40_29]|nr:MAG: hypothetical protein A2622_00385 [Bdellovibrionales bacterium RIFCSPHIGHO2_01_FULL_40_29]OFZ32582.1 MAG: hypothetical protein A3D17_04985 [Bdellovibrionales bacterium RIFCSPHIGHO2_02_FULL_40_15]